MELSNSQITIDSVLQPATNERTSKIICTIGPSCWSKEMLVKLIDAGMNVARLNFSHGDHQAHGNTLSNIRAACLERPNCNVAVLLDTKGAEIRTGFLEGDSVELIQGSIVEITTDYEFKGNASKFACSYKALPQSVKVGNVILVADGSVTLKVTEILEAGIMAEVLNTAKLGNRKNMNLPGCKVQLKTITPKDEDDIVNFGVVHGVDFIALSFVRTASDIEECRALLGGRGRGIKIIAKIEDVEGLQNYDEILAATDGIMVARGDLGMSISPQSVFAAQKMMIRKANIAGKPVITATQMLESMILNPRPTRAECTDVANSVIDGTDCTMLSGETAGGSWPIESVTIMSEICREAEAAVNHDTLFIKIRNTVSLTKAGEPLSIPEAVASSAVKTAIDMGAKLLVVLSETGNTARLVAKYRPSVPILVLTADAQAARQCSMYKGCRARVMGSMIGTNSILLRAAEIAKENKWVAPGDHLVAIHGMKDAISGASNMVKVLTVPSGAETQEDEDEDLKDLIE